MKGRAAVRYSSCQAGTGSEECVGKNSRLFFILCLLFFFFFFFWEWWWWVGERLLLILFLLCCQGVVWSDSVSVFVHCTIPESMEACFRVVLGGGGGGVLLGRGGGTCCGQTKNSELEFEFFFFFNQIRMTVGFARNSKSSGFNAAITHTLTDRSFLTGD